MAQGRPLTEIDFGELINSEKFTSAILKLNTNLEGTKAQLEAIAKCDVEKLSLKDQVMLDLYLAYSVNTLYWMFLRTKGINPATHAIKSEINRVREYVKRANKIYIRKQPRPTNRLNKEAAKRFIRSGLWKPGEKPAGGVVKKFDSTNLEGIASSSSSKVNEKGAEEHQFKVPYTPSNMERVVNKFDSILVGDVKAPSSCTKINKKGGETKQFKSLNRKPEGGFKKFDSTNVASTSFSKVNEKDGKTKQFKPPNRKPEGGFKKFDSKNAGAVTAPSSSSQINKKKGGETKQFKSPNGNAGNFKKFDPTNFGASSSFSQVKKKGGETKRFNSPNGKTGKKSNHNPYQYKKDEKLNDFGPKMKKDNKTTFHDSD